MQTENKQAIQSSTNDDATDWLSELLDGEISVRDRAEVIGQLCRDVQARERWALYHGIGDVMRGAPLLSSGFDEALRARLAAEPTVLAPRLRRYGPPALMALAASVAVVSIVAFMPSLTGNQGGGLQLAAGAGEVHNMQVETQMAPYMVAHQEFAPVAVASPYQRAVMTLDEQAK